MAAIHKITPSSPRMASLVSDVTKGNIKIPVFQREYVWNDEQIMSLLDSIYMGYPVGSILLWSTKTALNHERNVGGFKLPDTPRRLSGELRVGRPAASNYALWRIPL